MNKKIVWFGLALLIVLLGGSLGSFYYSSPIFKETITLKNIQTSQNNEDTSLSQKEADMVEVAPVVKNDTESKPDTSSKPANDDSNNSQPNTSPAGDFSVKQKLVSWGYQTTSSRKIDTIIIHNSYNALGGDSYSLDKLLEEYKQYGVAPHYLINRNGTIYQLVQDKNIAYHAGESKTPDGRTNVNSFSLGIELMNTEKDSCTASQYKALNTLIAKLKKQYSIKYILGHDQIAPGRKSDPWNFEWNKVNK